MKKSLIVSYRGLDEDEINFLYKLEQEYFRNVTFTTEHMINFIKEHMTVINSERGIELYKFFTGTKFCQLKYSYKEPLDISSLLTWSEEKNESYYLNFRDNEEYYVGAVTLTEKLEKTLIAGGLIYKIEPIHYYFEIIKRDDDTCILYIKYQQIIGSRAIAIIDYNSIIKIFPKHKK